MSIFVAIVSLYMIRVLVSAFNMRLMTAIMDMVLDVGMLALIVIFQPDMGRYVTGDMYSLKFVEFYEEKGVIPFCAGYHRRDSQNMW